MQRNNKIHDRQEEQGLRYKSKKGDAFASPASELVSRVP